MQVFLTFFLILASVAKKCECECSAYVGLQQTCCLDGGKVCKNGSYEERIKIAGAGKAGLCATLATKNAARDAIRASIEQKQVCLAFTKNVSCKSCREA